MRLPAAFVMVVMKRIFSLKRVKSTPVVRMESMYDVSYLMKPSTKSLLLMMSYS